MSPLPLHATPPSSSRWHWWVLGLCFLASCTATFVLVTMTCSGRVLPGRTLAHHELSGMTREEVVEFADSLFRNATLTLSVDGKELRTPFTQTGVVIDSQAIADAALAGSGPVASFLSLLHVSPIQEISVPTSIHDSDFLSFAQKADALTGQAPICAQVRLSEDGTQHVAIAGSPGQGVDRDILRKKLITVGALLENASLSLSSSLREPELTMTQAQEAASQANEIVSTPIVLTGPKDTNFTPEESEKAQWVKVEEKEGKLVPVLNRQAVSAWVDSVVSQVDRPAINGINAVDSQGVVLRLARPAKEGRRVNNTQALREGILHALDSRSEYSGTITWDRLEAQMDERVTEAGLAGLPYRPSAGEKWVDVNLTDSTLTVFRGQEVVYGPILINHGGVGHETVTGTYHVYLKYKAQDMGCTPEWPYCERGVPWVAYWHQSYALHGAPWVKEFGIGTDESSHGCINIPVEDAHWIHDFVEIGTTVVTHY